MEATLTIEPLRTVAPSAEELCRSYATRVGRFAALMSRNRDEAEDLAQESMLRALRGLRTYDARKGPIEAWLWGIVANAARDAAGRRRRLRDLLLRLDALTPREGPSVEEAALARISDAELRARLLSLSLRDQTLLALRFGADLDTTTVGAAVGLGADSASRAIRRALARLRDLLEDRS